MKPKTFVKMFDDMGALNDPDVVGVLHRVGCADERGRLGSETNAIDHLSLINTVFEAYRSVRFNDVFPNGESNVNKIKQGLYTARIQAIQRVLKINS